MLVLAAGCGSDDGSTSGANPSVSDTAAPSPTTAAAPATEGGTSAEVLTAAQAFLATLGDDERSAVVAARTQDNLAQWSNLPDQLFERAGLRMDALNTEQQQAAMAVLQAALSPEGYTQIQQITAADGVLAESGGPDLDFGADHYWVRFVGEPSASSPYTVQFGGHHLAVNATVLGSKLTLAPTLWGAQPASYEEAGATTEPLGGETTKAFALMAALDADQQQQATLDASMAEIVLGAGQDGKTLAPEGVQALTFTAEQKQLLLDLVDEWLRPLGSQDVAAKLAAARAEVDQMRFAWSGETTAGNSIYYRVQSPSFVIEFAHQQGQGANAGGVTHIHSIYRETENDYGAGLGG